VAERADNLYKLPQKKGCTSSYYRRMKKEMAMPFEFELQW